MADPEVKSPERESLEALLRIPLPAAMVEDAAALARTAAAAAREAAARLPFDARDPTGFLDALESLGPDRGALFDARVTPVGVHSHDDSPAHPDAAKDD